MAQTPSVNDNDYVLAFKATQNLYDYAIGQAIGGLSPPVYGRDTIVDLYKKSAYYTALLAE